MERLRELYLVMNESGRGRNANFEQLGKLICKKRPAEKIPLRLVTLMSLKECQFSFRFHALIDDTQLKAAAHADDCGHDGRLVGSSGDLADKRLVDLQSIDWKLS